MTLTNVLSLFLSVAWRQHQQSNHLSSLLVSFVSFLHQGWDKGSLRDAVTRPLIPVSSLPHGHGPSDGRWFRPLQICVHGRLDTFGALKNSDKQANSTDLTWNRVAKSLHETNVSNQMCSKGDWSSNLTTRSMIWIASRETSKVLQGLATPQCCHWNCLFYWQYWIEAMNDFSAMMKLGTFAKRNQSGCKSTRTRTEDGSETFRAKHQHIILIWYMPRAREECSWFRLRTLEECVSLEFYTSLHNI